MKFAARPPVDALRPGLRVWLSMDDAGVFGGGKWQLLDAIQRTGTLSAAAESLGISYRKAWGDLRKAERALGVLFLERRRGGSDGGESCLTDEGKKWWREYARFNAEMESHLERAFSRWKKRMIP